MDSDNDYGSAAVEATASLRRRSGTMRVEPMTPTIGAELHGIDLADAVHDDAMFAEIRALLLKRKVLFLHDQRFTRAEHVAFARRFGPLEDHPVVGSDPDHPGLVRIYKGPDSRQEQYENAWHCDTTWRECPQFGAVLRCVEGPAVGGDMLWANMALAYERLPEGIKAQIAGLRARHSIEASFGAAMPAAKRLALHAQFPDAEHPAVRTHPETGEKVLFVNAFATHFTNFHAGRPGLCAGRRQPAALPDQPGRHPRVPGAIPLADQQRSDLGQPLHAALCGAGLLARRTQSGTRRHRRRQAQLKPKPVGASASRCPKTYRPASRSVITRHRLGTHPERAEAVIEAVRLYISTADKALPTHPLTEQFVPASAEPSMASARAINEFLDRP
jgi:taurine dioxygenase